MEQRSGQPNEADDFYVIEGSAAQEILEIIECCKDVLPRESRFFMLGMEVLEAVDYLIVILPEYGVTDPKAFLQQRGIIM